MRILQSISASVTLGLTLSGAVFCASAASADTTQCLITNTSTGFTNTNMAAAQEDANSGDTLLVHGTCTGTAGITRNLTIIGVPSPGLGAPTLDGDHLGTVLSINSGLTVKISKLTITGGDALPIGDGGAIVNYGTLTLDDVAVTGNIAAAGGGIFNYGGTLIMNGSHISGNTATQGDREGLGGAIYNDSSGVVTMNHSTISGNTSYFQGGGIFNTENSRVTMANGSAITGNTTGSQGGGIYTVAGSVTMNGRSTIAGNTAADDGGGIFDIFGVVTMNDHSRIARNSAADGGGIYGADATVTMNGWSRITLNSATSQGGGIYYGGGLVTVNQHAAVVRNKPDNIFT